MRSLVVVSLLVVLSATAAVAQTTVEWSPELQVKLKAAGTPRVSPDGKRVVYTVSEAAMTADKSEYVSQIWLGNIDTKQNVQLTFGDSHRVTQNGRQTATGSRSPRTARTTRTTSIS